VRATRNEIALDLRYLEKLGREIVVLARIFFEDPILQVHGFLLMWV
jgi:hypothetical protein